MNRHEAATLMARDGEELVLEGVSAHGTLDGLLLSMTLEQRFRNPTQRHLEVVYTFPLPWGAVLLDLRVCLAGRQLVANVVEARSATQRYEDAISDGDTAILLERHDNGNYTLNLGNLAPAENCEVMLLYAQVQTVEKAHLRITIPTVIAPLYGDPVRDGGLQPHQAPITDLLADYPFDIRVALRGRMSEARVASPSHPIAVARQGDELCVSLARRGALDRDFVLVLEGLTETGLALVASDPWEPGKAVALAVFSPYVPPAESAGSVAIKVLVDCSGSMAGESIQAARRALVAAIRTLKPQDRFSLSRFGSHVEHRSRGLWRTTDATRLAGERWALSMEADMGGTEMRDALHSTLALVADEEADVLLVTDGQIEAVDDVIQAMRRKPHRIFVVGIGSSPQHGLLRTLAAESGGACEFVAPGEAVEAAILRMFSRLRGARVSGIDVEWPGGVLPIWQSPLPPSVFSGDEIPVFATFSTAPQGSARLLHRRSKDAAPMELASALLATPIEDEDLARVVAAARICQLDERGIDDATRLALRYRLVSPHTHYLLVDERVAADKAIDMSHLHKVAQMPPAGWGGLGGPLRSSERLCLFETRAIEYNAGGPLDWSDIDVPPGADIRFSVADGPDVEPTVNMLAEWFGKSERVFRQASYWSDGPEGHGLTPLGLAELLQITPTSAWPSSYAGLRRFGLGMQVVEWLELVGALTSPEEEVVAAFLHLMSQVEVQRSLASGDGVEQAFADVLARMSTSKGSPAGTIAAPSDMVLMGRIAYALKEAARDRWPDAVLQMLPPTDTPTMNLTTAVK